MWLLDTSTLELREFFENVRPPYAIFSHTWDSQEVNFVEMHARNTSTLAKTGFNKIRSFCRIARELGYSYGWVDTCCIDKRNSADLSEAINSMYGYYNSAAVCIVYLSDLRPEIFWEDFTTNQLANLLKACRWFTRGWTLQELIAPSRRLFFARDWTPVRNANLDEALSVITHISSNVLRFREALIFCCTAERMSWAAHRQTTRSEDMAYSLMGLFNVCMPVIYGEGGKRAFRRLQEEIMRASPDQTIFAWRAKTERDSTGFLADSPAVFKSFVDMPIGPSLRPTNLASFSMTNVGLSIRLHVIKISDTERACLPPTIPRDDGLHLGIMECPSFNDTSVEPSSHLAMYLRKVIGAGFFANGRPCEAYRRVLSDRWTPVSEQVLNEWNELGQTTEILVLEDEQYYSMISLTLL